MFGRLSALRNIIILLSNRRRGWRMELCHLLRWHSNLDRQKLQIGSPETLGMRSESCGSMLSTKSVTTNVVIRLEEFPLYIRTLPTFLYHINWNTPPRDIKLECQLPIWDLGVYKAMGVNLPDYATWNYALKRGEEPIRAFCAYNFTYTPWAYGL
jgi:hypothetical protein